MENIIGKELGPYRVLEKLGEGGMATVFLAYQASVDRKIALKVLPRQLANEANFVGRFEQEARLVARLQHPHILSVFDYGESDGYTYIAMPFVRNGTLAEQLSGRPWSLARVERLTRQIAGALDYAHDQGLVHRDIKPSNILVDESGNYLLTDFGIAKLYEGAAHFTRTGGILGTPAYMSPEQGLGEPLDRRSDIYSLGIVLYELVTGRVPFKAETPIATVYKHINDPLPPPREFNATLPQGVERVIYKALAKAPGDRFQSAGALSAALQKVVRDPYASTAETIINGGTIAPAGDAGERGIPRWLLAAGAILLLFILGAAAIFGMRGMATRRSATVSATETTSAALVLLSETATALAQSSATLPATPPEQSPSVEPTLIPADEPALTATAAGFRPTSEPTLLPAEEPTSTSTIEASPTAMPPPPTIPARVELTGSGTVQMSNDDEPSYTPGFADDQRAVYAATEIDGYWRVVRYDTTTGERQVLTQQSADFWHPRPNKDGTQALVSSDFEGNHDIYLLDLRSGELLQKLTDASGDDTYARWLPDESGFIFLSYRDGDAEVWLQRFDGSGPRQLTNNGDGIFDGFADISPDGLWVTFQSNRDGNHEVYIMRLDGDNLQRLTYDDGRDAVPVFSRDGEWIAFESTRGGNYDIWAVRTNGQDLFNVTNTGGRDQVPEFSPDGRWLAFQSDRDGDWDIYRVPWPFAP